MPLAHLLNLAVHIGIGALAISLGFVLLNAPKGDAAHRRRGRVFACGVLVVCATGAIGNVFFRFVPLFAVLTALVSYQLLSGWHAVYTREAGPNRVDALLTLAAALWLAVLLRPLLGAAANPSARPVVVVSTLAALALMIAYDAARWIFPRRWHGALWRYEHIYKLTASLFAMLSAASGNLIRFGQPWSQIAPSLLGVLCIAYFFWREGRPRAPAPLTARRPAGA